jgi:HIT domain
MHNAGMIYGHPRVSTDAQDITSQLAQLKRLFEREGSMQTDSDCVFCKIVAEQISCVKLHEDDATLAFMDINPANDGHCLVITKRHYPTVFEISDEAFAAVARSVRKVARAVNLALSPEGLNLVQANGEGPSSRSSISIFTCCRANLAITLSSIGASIPAIVKPSPRLRIRFVPIFRVLRAGVGE